jgi:penicillin-binding protein 1A
MRTAHEGLPPLLLPGTAVADPQAELAMWGGAANHLPRVVEGREVLPWQRAAAAQAPAFKAEVASQDEPRISHPAGGIGEDFIKKALATSDGSGEKPAISAAAPEVSAAQSGNSPLSNWW